RDVQHLGFLSHTHSNALAQSSWARNSWLRGILTLRVVLRFVELHRECRLIGHVYGNAFDHLSVWQDHVGADNLAIGLERLPVGRLHSLDVLGEFTGPQELQEYSVIPLKLRLLLPEPQFAARKADRLLAGVAGVEFQEPQDPLLGFPQYPSPAVIPLEDFVDLPLNKVIDGLNLAFDPAVFGQQPGSVVRGLGHPVLLPDVLWLGLGLEFAVKFQRHVPSPPWAAGGPSLRAGNRDRHSGSALALNARGFRS